MEELRAHVRKYGPVMQRYYVQYLSGFDAVVLNELVQVRIHFQSYITQNLQQGNAFLLPILKPTQENKRNHKKGLYMYTHRLFKAEFKTSF